MEKEWIKVLAAKANSSEFRECRSTLLATRDHRDSESRGTTYKTTIDYAKLNTSLPPSWWGQEAFHLKMLFNPEGRCEKILTEENNKFSSTGGQNQAKL